MYGITRQAYYKKKREDLKRDEKEAHMLERVRELRQHRPKTGCRKLKVHLEKQGIIYGRDKIFELLKREDMLIKPKQRYMSITDSTGAENLYRNLTRGKEITAPDQVYVSDTTYIRTSKGFKYLALVMDAYARKIVGYSVSYTNDTELCIKAMQMALKAREGSKTGLIHHSDQGCQYSSNRYKEQLESCGIIQSMSRRGNPYDNARAERVIGTLKREYFLGYKFKDDSFLDLLITQIIKSYNSERLHISLGYRTPDEVYYGKSISNSSQATPSWSYLN
jgi:transposase InsO family protein